MGPIDAWFLPPSQRMGVASVGRTKRSAVPAGGPIAGTALRLVRPTTGMWRVPGQRPDTCCESDPVALVRPSPILSVFDSTFSIPIRVECYCTAAKTVSKKVWPSFLESPPSELARAIQLIQNERHKIETQQFCKALEFCLISVRRARGTGRTMRGRRKTSIATPTSVAANPGGRSAINHSSVFAVRST